jgi:predicted enzyme related to lactoylglutathione lyase
VEGEHESYRALAMSNAISGGAVEAEAGSSWLPYAEVRDIDEATGHAERLGAAVILEPREGPAGWRSVLGVPAGAEVALWQPKL